MPERRERVRHPSVNTVDIARVLYALNPALKRWDGDAYGFYERGAGHERELAMEQAEAVIEKLTIPARTSTEGENT